MIAAPVLQSPDERAAQVERLDIVYKINADGSYIESSEEAVKVLKPEALEQLKNSSVAYSASIQKVEVVAAYTLKPDGRRIDVARSNYQVRTNAGHDGGAPVFTDKASLTVVFPDLAVGDTTVFAYRLVGSKPMFENEFSDTEVFARHIYYRDLKVTYDAPAELAVKHQSWGMQQVRDDVVDGRRISQWRLSNTQPLRQGPDQGVFEFGHDPGVAYSTFAGYSAIASAYGKLALPKATVTPRIRKLADMIAGREKDPRAVAKALYEWVSTNITYSVNEIGLGAVVPHELDLVLDNKMGDCKDHVTLLQALLSAKGIQSTQALVNAGKVYRLPDTPVASAVNHVINYVPQLDLYLDATAKGVPFGMLPAEVMGKPVLMADGSREGAKTPTIAPDRNRQTVRTRLMVAADGSIVGESDVELQGTYAVAARADFRGRSHAEINDSVNRYFQGIGSEGSGSIVLEDASPLADHYRYSVRFKVGQAVSVPGAMTLSPAFPAGASVSQLASVGNAEIDMGGDLACTGGISQEEYVVEFASPMRVVSIPPGIALSSPFASYKASYALDGKTVRAKLEVDDRTPGPTCTSQYGSERKAFMQKVLANLKAQMVYQ
ncbi:MAG TPA: DUF3857 and transglutaminase domain-containing protein [Lysobacter sp.]